MVLSPEGNAIPFRGIAEINGILDAPPYLTGIEDDREDVKLSCMTAGGEKHRFDVGSVLAFRKTEERFMLSDLADMDHCGTLGSFALVSSDSDFIDWLVKQSMETMVDLHLSHVRLVFVQDIVDFIVAGDVFINHKRIS